MSGLGAAVMLAPETGLHVLEVSESSDGGGRSLERVHVTVELSACAPGERGDRAALRLQAEAAFAQLAGPAQVARRNRTTPSALVRDVARGYRTGRLESVLAGNFDLFAGGTQRQPIATDG